MSALSGAGVSSDGSTCRSSEHLVYHAKDEKKRAYYFTIVKKMVW